MWESWLFLPLLHQNWSNSNNQPPSGSADWRCCTTASTTNRTTGCDVNDKASSKRTDVDVTNTASLCAFTCTTDGRPRGPTFANAKLCNTRKAARVVIRDGVDEPAPQRQQFESDG